MKTYNEYRPDLADAAAVLAAIVANPDAYVPGTLIMAADFSLTVVKASGTAGVVTVV